MLTDLTIRQTKIPTEDRTELRDSKVSGLVLRITPNGARTWSVFYRNAAGKNRRFTLGDYRPEGSIAKGLTLGEARKRAKTVLREVGDGRDPQQEKVDARRAVVTASRLAGPTFQSVAELWLCSEAAKAWKPKTHSEFKRIVERELVPVVGDLNPEAVTKKHVRAIYDNIAGRSKSMAKHTLAVLRLFYQWAAEEDHVDTAPIMPKRGTQSNKRDRVLEESELRAVWLALDAGIGTTDTEEDLEPEPEPDRVDMMAEAFRLMLLTAQRRGEVLSMQWTDVTEEKNGVWWTIPAERHKSGREQRVPLTAPAVEALKRLHSITSSGPWCFPSPKPTSKLPHVGNPQKAADRLWEKCKVDGATLHDLRRSAATYMTRLGVPRLQVAKVLGHADADVTGRYDKYAYDAEKRSALERWAAEVLRVVADKQAATEGAKVLPWAPR